MKKFALILAAISFLTYSCKKEGCTNSEATNYSSEANTDDGSCEYETNVSFWVNQGTSDILVNWYSVSELSIYVNNTLVGTMNPNDWSSGPDCGGANFTATWSMGNKTTQAFNYAANDQTGNQQFYGTGNFTPNLCLSIQLEW